MRMQHVVLDTRHETNRKTGETRMRSIVGAVDPVFGRMVTIDVADPVGDWVDTYEIEHECNHVSQSKTVEGVVWVVGLEPGRSYRLMDDDTGKSIYGTADANGNAVLK